MIQVESFNMREGTCLGKPRNVFNRRTRTCADNNIFPPKDACAAISKRNLNRFGSDEAPGPHSQFRPARLKISEVRFHQSIYIFRLRSRTPDMWIWQLSLVFANSP